MHIELRISGGEDAQGLRSLREWLTEEPDLRGHVRMIERPPAPGELGSELEALVVGLGPGGAITAAVGLLVSWLRRRRGTLKLRVVLPDGGSVELESDVVSALPADELYDLVDRLVERIGPNGEPAGEEPDDAAS